jgi:hypothetical protein
LVVFGYITGSISVTVVFIVVGTIVLHVTAACTPSSGVNAVI